MKAKMNAKNIMVSFFAVACLLLLASTVTALELADDAVIYVDDVVVAMYDGTTSSFTQISVPEVTVGESMEVTVKFTAANSDTDVSMVAELNWGKEDVEGYSRTIVVEALNRNSKGLTANFIVPFNLKDDYSDVATLEIEIEGKDHQSIINDINVNVLRVGYQADIKSITFDSTVDAGETFPVDIVLKNMGYNDLDDLYVTVSIPELGLSKGPTYFGDLVPFENCTGNCDEEDTVSGRLYLEIPYEADAGMYTLQVEVTTDEMTLTESKSILIEKGLSDEVIVSSLGKSALVGEQAEYTMLLVNPTDELKVYRIVTESSSDLSASASDTVVAVQAGSSETVRILASASEAGQYTFDVNVFEGEQLASTTSFSLDAEGEKSFAADPIVILTIVLAIVFLVLLVVLIVLIGKKPSKTEEFGESYY